MRGIAIIILGILKLLRISFNFFYSIGEIFGLELKFWSLKYTINQAQNYLLKNVIFDTLFQN